MMNKKCTVRFLEGDCLESLKLFSDQSVQCVITSPPYYGLRDYGVDGQIGNEKSPEEYICNLVCVFREVWRVLKDNGTLWLNLGDSYWGGKGKSGQAWSTTHLDRNTLQKKQHQISGKGETRPTDGKHDVYKPKDLLMMPARVAMALQADGWYLRSEIVWHKPNPMPESVKDRPTKSHEMIYLLTKSSKYYYDSDAILEPATGFDGRKDTVYKGGLKDMAGGRHERWPRTTKNLMPDGQTPNTMHKRRADGLLDVQYPARNKRTVWTVATKPYREAHFATYPEALIVPCILAGSREGDIILDPFSGAGTTGLVAVKNNRSFIGCELNPKYIEIAKRRIGKNSD